LSPFGDCADNADAIDWAIVSIVGLVVLFEKSATCSNADPGYWLNPHSRVSGVGLNREHLFVCFTLSSTQHPVNTGRPSVDQDHSEQLAPRDCDVSFKSRTCSFAVANSAKEKLYAVAACFARISASSLQSRSDSVVSGSARTTDSGAVCTTDSVDEIATDVTPPSMAVHTDVLLVVVLAHIFSDIELLAMHLPRRSTADTKEGNV
jgi:hypothetical protein